jgi:hypothetical protein
VVSKFWFDFFCQSQLTKGCFVDFLISELTLTKKFKPKFGKHFCTTESRVLLGKQAKTDSYGLNHRIGHRCVGVLVCSKSFLLSGMVQWRCEFKF